MPTCSKGAQGDRLESAEEGPGGPGPMKVTEEARPHVPVPGPGQADCLNLGGCELDAAGRAADQAW